MTQKLKLVVFVVVFQFHWHFFRWVAGQNTQTQYTQAQITQNRNTQGQNFGTLGILGLGISGLGILGLDILLWNRLVDRKFNLQILGLAIFIIFCSWPPRFLTFTSYKNSNFGQTFFNFGYFELGDFGFDS